MRERKGTMEQARRWKCSWRHEKRTYGAEQRAETGSYGFLRIKVCSWGKKTGDWDRKWKAMNPAGKQSFLSEWGNNHTSVHHQHLTYEPWRWRSNRHTKSTCKLWCCACRFMFHKTQTHTSKPQHLCQLNTLRLRHTPFRKTYSQKERASQSLRESNGQKETDGHVRVNSRDTIWTCDQVCLFAVLQLSKTGSNTWNGYFRTP